MRRNHSIIAYSRHVYMGTVLRAHPVRGESHIQYNANGEVEVVSSVTALFTTIKWIRACLCIYGEFVSTKEIRRLT